MVSTNRKAVVRAYMRENDVKYTEALRALGNAPAHDLESAVQFVLLRDGQFGGGEPRPGDPAFATLSEAKAAGGEHGDLVSVGFFAPEVAGGPSLWHNHPHGKASVCYHDPWRGAQWGDPVYWDDSPRVPYGWSSAWFRRFPTPKDAVLSSGLANGDTTNGLDGVMFRFVNASGALVTRVVPDLSIQATFAQYIGQHGLLDREMERITAELDPRLGIRLRSAPTVHGGVRYWEFESPDLARFVSWSSVDRHEEEHIDALHAWIADTYPYGSSINQLPFAEPEICEFCDDPITRQHPLAPGRMIGSLGDSESVDDIEMPINIEQALSWEDFLLMYVYGGLQLVSHDGCASYWAE